MNTDTIVIEVKNLSVEFGSFKAVDDITFSVKKGEIFGFLGANGAGKTTTIRTICGILNPSSGKIYVYGKDVSQDTSSMKNKIGYISQKITLYNDLTVNENIEFQVTLHNMDATEIKKQTQKLFNFINFSADANSIVSNLP
jgi:ABC-2 type transport system ATP-binding protein